MTQAKYYIYRNLHKNTFSVRYKGKVIAHHDNIVATGVTFKVSALGRARVLHEKVKNVHAHVVCDSYAQADYLPSIMDEILTHCDEVYYNPYRCSQFTYKSNEIHTTSGALLTNNKVYI